jgi:hypothetical protein
MRRSAPAILTEFAEDRRGWRVYQEKLDCWVASRRMRINERDVLLLVTPNWRDKESGRDWDAEVIDSSDGNARLASHRGWSYEVLREIRLAERTLELGYALATPHISREQALEMLKNVRGAQLELLRKALGVRAAGAPVVRIRIVAATCGGMALSGGL